MAFLASVGIVVMAMMLLSYGRKNEVSSILTFGYILDAIAVSGILGNLIFFILAKTTKINRLRLAFGTFGVVHVVLFLVAALVASRADPAFHAGAVTISYVVSFFFWTGLHWAWQRTETKAQTI